MPTPISTCLPIDMEKATPDEIVTSPGLAAASDGRADKAAVAVAAMRGRCRPVRRSMGSPNLALVRGIMPRFLEHSAVPGRDVIRSRHGRLADSAHGAACFR